MSNNHQLALTCIPCLDAFEDDEDALEDFDLLEAVAAEAKRAIGSLGSEVC